MGISTAPVWLFCCGVFLKSLIGFTHSSLFANMAMKKTLAFQVPSGRLKGGIRIGKVCTPLDFLGKGNTLLDYLLTIYSFFPSMDLSQPETLCTREGHHGPEDCGSNALLLEALTVLLGKKKNTGEKQRGLEGENPHLMIESVDGPLHQKCVALRNLKWERERLFLPIF